MVNGALSKTNPWFFDEPELQPVAQIAEPGGCEREASQRTVYLSFKLNGRMRCGRQICLPVASAETADTGAWR
jgi:hypothetical protein